MSLVTVELTPHTYTPLREIFYFFQSCLHSTVSVTPSDSDPVNRNAALQRFRLKSTDSSQRVRFFAFIHGAHIKCPTDQIFWGGKRPRRQYLWTKMRRRQDCCEWTLMGNLCCRCSTWFIFHKSQLRIFFFEQIKNWWIESFIHHAWSSPVYVWE